MRFVVVIVFCLIQLTFFGQDVKQGLIVIHVDPSGKGDFKQKIYKYNFLNGHYQSREELLTVQGKKEGKDYIRTDLGINQLYKERYLITGIGNIIDLKDKKVLFDGRANLVRLSNDSAIYYTNDAFKGKFYSVYNFKTNTYGEVKSLTFKAKVGADVEFDKTALPYKLNYYPQNKPKVLLAADAGYGQINTSDVSKPDPTLWWIDNANFVYANYNKENTELTINKVNIDSKAIATVGKIVIKPETTSAKFLVLSNKEALIFLGAKHILIDLTANTVSDLQFSKPTENFSYECKTNSYGHIIKLNDKEIGKYHFQTKNFKTSKNIAAIVKEINLGNESYQQGLGVWNNDKQKWESVDCEDVLTLVGFVKD